MHVSTPKRNRLGELQVSRWPLDIIERCLKCEDLYGCTLNLAWAGEISRCLLTVVIVETSFAFEGGGGGSDSTGVFHADLEYIRET